jgi:hypothetical protein
MTGIVESSSAIRRAGQSFKDDSRRFCDEARRLDTCALTSVRHPVSEESKNDARALIGARSRRAINCRARRCLCEAGARTRLI